MSTEVIQLLIMVAMFVMFLLSMSVIRRQERDRATLYLRRFAMTMHGDNDRAKAYASERLFEAAERIERNYASPAE